MAHQVRTNVALVDLPGVGRIELANTTVVLTDADFAQIPAAAFAGGSPLLTDLGVLAESGDAVATQANHVANVAAQTSAAVATANATDLASAEALANANKTAVNALVTDVANLQTTVNAILAALQVNGGPMKSS